jgi:hypothetical protein
MIMKHRSILFALLLCLITSAVAKRTPTDYTTQLVVRADSEWMSGTPSIYPPASRPSINPRWRCYNIISADDHVYAIASERNGCDTMTNGAHGYFKLGSTWGVRWFAITWIDEKGATHHHKYEIVRDVYFGE